MAGNPYSGGPQIGGLYDSNLKAALTEQATKAGERNATKKSFASLLSTGITAANTARVAEANRINQVTMNNARITAQDERMREQEQIKFTNDLKKEEKKIERDAQDINKFFTARDALRNNAEDPDLATSSEFELIKDHYLKSGKDPRYAKMLIDSYGAKDIQDAEDMMDGIMEPNYNTTYNQNLRKIAIRNALKKQAEADKAVNEGKKTKLEAEDLERDINIISVIEEDLDTVVNSEAFDKGERAFFKERGKERLKTMATKKTREAAAEKRMELESTAAPAMDTIQNSVETLRSGLIKLHNAGGSLNWTENIKKVWERVGGDKQAFAQEIAEIDEKNLVDFGNVDPRIMSLKEQARLKTDIINGFNFIKSRSILIGKQESGQVGAQSDYDALLNLSAFYVPGNSVALIVDQLNQGENNFTKSYIYRATHYGSSTVLEDQLKRLHDRGYKLDSSGTVIDILGPRNRYLDAYSKATSPERLKEMARSPLYNPEKTQFTTEPEPETLNSLQGLFVDTPTKNDLGGLFDG